MNVTQSTKLLTGTPAPKLEVETLDGQLWKLSEQTPKNYTMVVFYRGWHCPICKRYLAELERQLSDLTKLGIEAITLSGDSKEQAQKSKDQWGLEQVTLGYGLRHESMRQWGLYVSKGAFGNEPPLFGEPALFLVRPDGVVVYAAINSAPFGRPSFSEIASSIDYMLKKNSYPIRGAD